MIPEDLEKCPPYGSVAADYMRTHVTKDRTNKIQCHPYSEIVIIKSGVITYTTGNNISALEGKSIIYNREGTIHNPFVQYKEIYERYKIKFYLKDICNEGDALSSLLSRSFAKQIDAESFDEIYANARRIFITLQKKSPTSTDHIYARSELTAIMIHAASATGREQKSNDNYIVSVAEYINAKLKEKLSINGIADTFFVSKSKLIYDFKAYCNMSINEYITLGRVERAKDMLKLGYSVSSVASECGFSSPSYLIKVFSSITGTTPLKYQLQSSRSIK